MAIEYNFTLDMDRSKRDNNIAYARTGDVDSITINADLVLNGTAYTPVGTNAFFECITPNGHSIRAAAEKAGSTVSIEVPSAAFQAAGVINVAYFRFESGEADNPTYVESTEPFAIVVREGIGDDVDAGDYIEEWRALADHLEAVVAEVEQKAEQAEAAINEQKTEVDQLKAQAQTAIAGDVTEVEAAAQSAITAINQEKADVADAAEDLIDFGTQAQEAEDARNEAEAKRAAAEEQRSENEIMRSEAEESRVSAEDSRSSAEALRAQAEALRAQAEELRVQAESARAAAESARQSAETLRIAAEQQRETDQAKNNADQAANNAAAQGLQVVILTDGQFDADSGEPIIEGEAGKLYFVPEQASPIGAHAATVDAGDNYVEWMWINNTWERVGMSEATIVPISTDEIDAVVEGGSGTGEQVLNLTGLSYYWTKVKAWAQSVFAKVAHTHQASDITGFTPLRAVVSNSAGGLDASTVTTNELGCLSGVESPLQDQIDTLRDSVSQAIEPIQFEKMTSDPEFQISGVVIGGAIGVVTLRWVNLGQFVSQAWSSGVLLAKMAGWSSVHEHQSICADNITFDESLPGLSVASAVGSDISWRTSGTVEVGAHMWHEAQLVFPVSRS